MPTLGNSTKVFSESQRRQSRRISPRAAVAGLNGELKVHFGVEENFGPARKAHPAFIVDDLAGLTAVLENAGSTIPLATGSNLMEIKPS
jgi:hypothetical protein